jgi:hypothetical protein
MTDWIFQANLKRYDVHAEAAHIRTWWNTPWHRAEIAISDRVWLQIAGPYTPGLHYVATVESAVYESTEIDDPDSPAFGKWRTDIRFDYRIHPMLAREDLLNDPEIGSFRPLRGFQGSNQRVPSGVASRLLKLATPRLVPLSAGLSVDRSDALSWLICL